MLGNGTFSKVNNNVIDNNTINPLKLTGADGNNLTYLAGDGLFKTLPSGNFTSTTKVINSNFDDNSINVTKLVDGVSKTYVDSKVQNLTSDNIIVNNNLNVNGLLTSENVLIKHRLIVEENVEIHGTLLGQFNNGNGDVSNPENYSAVNINNIQTRNINAIDNVSITGNLTVNGNVNIPDYSISANKLVNYPNDGLKYLSGDGSWKVVTSGSGSSFDPSTLRLNTITSSADVSLNNFKITNLSNGINNNDAINKSQLDSQNTNLTSYVDNKYLSYIDSSIIQPNNTYSGPSQVGGGGELAKYLNVHSILNLDSNRIVNVADPVNGQDVVTKNYLNSNSATTTYVDNSLINYNKKLKGTITSTSYVSTGITITGGPIRIAFQMRETSGFGGWKSRNQEITIFNNNANNSQTWTNTRYYLYGFNSVNGNDIYADVLTNGVETASGVGSFIVNGSYIAGSSIMLRIDYGIISLKLQNTAQVYDYYVAYQY